MVDYLVLCRTSTLLSTLPQRRREAEFARFLVYISISFMSNRDALVCFFRGTGGTRWFRRDYWDLETPLYKWYGVKTDEAGHVSSIDLNSNRLEGQIPFHNGEQEGRCKYLRDVKVLSLESNLLHGPIPSGIRLLMSLQTLNLAWNKLSGDIPESLSTLTDLRVLKLEHNFLTGNIPMYLKDFKELRVINFSCNHLKGEVPLEMAMLKELSFLDFSANETTGTVPKTVKQLRELYAARVGGGEEGKFAVAAAADEELKEQSKDGVDYIYTEKFVGLHDHETEVFLRNKRNEQLRKENSGEIVLGCAASPCTLGYEAPLRYRKTERKGEIRMIGTFDKDDPS